MKKNVLILSALCFAAMTLIFSGCKKETNDPQEPAKVQTYQMSIQASKGANDNQANGPRRVLSLEGGTLTATWAKDEAVTVHNNTRNADLTGTLTAQSAGATVLLTGTLTGTIEAGDELLLKYLSPNYADQEGTLGYISANCDYATATVTVATVEDGAITANANAVFDNQQAIVKFTLDDGNGNTLSPTELIINNGTADIATLTNIPAATYTTNGAGVLYVAIPATSVALTLTATAADGTYTKAVTGSNAALSNGAYYQITLSMTKQTAPAAVPEGGINGEFNLCDKKIWFSKGNLQYNAYSNTWRFAEHQYDIAGADNKNISESYNGWIDLFGWATSGINTPVENTYYQPWSTDNTNANYGSGITSKADWADEHANYDWGNNAISNGGNTANSGWRTLTADEWYCLVYDRAGATVNSVSSICHAWAKIGDRNGLILFPDGGTFTKDEFTTIPDTKGVFNEMEYNSTTCTLEQWAALEAKGCVFLPAASARYGTTGEFRIISKGYYWSSTAASNTNAYFGVAFQQGELTTSHAEETASRSDGLSVRLVKDAN